MEKAIAPTTTTRSTPALTAARLSVASSVTTLVLLATLHILRPEFDPSWRMVSEYALGNYGWVLSLMFLTWALSCVCLFFAVKPQIHTIGGKIGLGFLLVAGTLLEAGAGRVRTAALFVSGAVVGLAVPALLFPSSWLPVVGASAGVAALVGGAATRWAGRALPIVLPSSVSGGAKLTAAYISPFAMLTAPVSIMLPPPNRQPQ